MNDAQRVFLEQLAERIPRLFAAIAAGNVRAEFIVGLRRVGRRHVRLKLIAEVVDPGANPLGTHGVMPALGTLGSALHIEAIAGAGGEHGGGHSDSGSRSGPRERRARARAVRNSDPPPDS